MAWVDLSITRARRQEHSQSCPKLRIGQVHAHYRGTILDTENSVALQQRHSGQKHSSTDPLETLRTRWQQIGKLQQTRRKRTGKDRNGGKGRPPTFDCAVRMSRSRKWEPAQTRWKTRLFSTSMKDVS